MSEQPTQDQRCGNYPCCLSDGHEGPCSSSPVEQPALDQSPPENRSIPDRPKECTQESTGDSGKAEVGSPQVGRGVLSLEHQINESTGRSRKESEDGRGSKRACERQHAENRGASERSAPSSEGGDAGAGSEGGGEILRFSTGKSGVAGGAGARDPLSSKTNHGPLCRCPTCEGSNHPDRPSNPGYDPELALRQTIAGLLDLPSVYMGGPSKQNLKRADEVIAALRCRSNLLAQLRTAEIERLRSELSDERLAHENCHAELRDELAGHETPEQQSYKDACARLVKYQHALCTLLGCDGDTDSIDLHERIKTGVERLQRDGAIKQASIQQLQSIIRGKTFVTGDETTERHCELEQDGQSHDLAPGVVCIACYNRATLKTASPQAPIARMMVADGFVSWTHLNAPGLPDGIHEVYCEPEAMAPYMRAAKSAEQHTCSFVMGVCACGNRSADYLSY